MHFNKRIINWPPFLNTVYCSGEFLSGPEEIDSHRRRQELVRLYPHAIAVEMDGEGKKQVADFFNSFDCTVISVIFLYVKMHKVIRSAQ